MKKKKNADMSANQPLFLQLNNFFDEKNIWNVLKCKSSSLEGFSFVLFCFFSQNSNPKILYLWVTTRKRRERKDFAGLYFN